MSAENATPTFEALDQRSDDVEALTSLIAASRSAALRAMPLGWPDWPRRVAETLVEHPLWLAQFARVGARVVGVKLGYAERPARFYSWIGGVDPQFRRRGIARRMMADQHAWCVDHGFEQVATSTTNDFRGMLLLNVQSGFDIIGTKSSGGRLSILMQKELPGRR